MRSSTLEAGRAASVNNARLRRNVHREKAKTKEFQICTLDPFHAENQFVELRLGLLVFEQGVL